MNIHDVVKLNDHTGLEVPHVKKYSPETEAIIREDYTPWLAEKERSTQLEKEGLPMIEEFGRAPLPTEFGDFTYIVYGDMRNGKHINVLVYGQVENLQTENILVRIHSACWTNEVAHSINCECRKEIQLTLSLIQQEGQDILIYLDQEGRGAGIAGKMAQLNGMFGWFDGKIDQKRDSKTGERIDTDRAYKEAGYPSECRTFNQAGEVLKQLGIKSVRLLTNNPIKIKGIEEAGIKVTPTEIHIAPDNGIIASDLKSKAKNLGHNIGDRYYSLK